MLFRSWRPVNAFDDGRKVYIEFSSGIGQGEMPPLFVIGQDGKPDLVNYRVYKNVLIADRLFAAAAFDDETPSRLKPGVSWESASSQERADASETIYMPISARGGNLLYALVRASRP